MNTFKIFTSQLAEKSNLTTTLRLCIYATLAFLLLKNSYAILDTNSNGMSDVWEREYNEAQLFSSANPDHDPTADPDADGWTNATECVAATDPFDGQEGEGKTQLLLEQTTTQGSFMLSWYTMPGKNYRIQASTDLTYWFNVGTIIYANGIDTYHTEAINATQPDSTIPPKLFWRIKIEDLDPDTDGLNNYEEFAYGTDPSELDSDGDELSDYLEILNGTDPLNEDSPTEQEGYEPPDWTPSFPALWDIKDVLNADDDVLIPDWDPAKNIGNHYIAFIEAHRADDDPSPRMPQLEFRTDDGSGLVTQAKLTVQYQRGNGARSGNNQTEDKVQIPENGSYHTIVGNVWSIYAYYNHLPFFGGEAVLEYRVVNESNEEVVYSDKIRFRIGGNNPDPQKAREYIESLPNANPQGSLWFAYAIAKHESKDYNGPGTRYNQFYLLPTEASDNHLRLRRRRHAGRPVFGDDRNPNGTPRGPGGYGICQVTGTASSQLANIPREQIWNWQKNAIAGNTILTSKLSIANTWMTSQRSQALQQRGQAVPVPMRTEANVVFADGTARTIENAVTMKAYNGASRGHYCAWDNAGQGSWKFNLLNSENFNYTLRVCEEVEP